MLSDCAVVRRMHPVNPDAGLMSFCLSIEVASVAVPVESGIAGLSGTRTPPSLDRMCDQMILLGTLLPRLTAQTSGSTTNETSLGGSDSSSYVNLPEL